MKTETPSQQIVKKSSKTVSFKDGDDREIVIKKLTALDEYNLFKVIGKAQENQGQFVALMTVFHVVSIDGEPVVKGSLLQLEATLNRIGDAFIDLSINVMKLKAEDMPDAQKLQDQIKNLLPDQT